MLFPGGIDSNPNGTLLFSLAAAVLYAVILEMRPSLARSAAKTLSVALLAVLSFMQGGPWLLGVALVLSAIGDAFLSRDGDKAFLGGLGSFLAAHLVYIALFWQAGGGFGLLSAEPWRGALAILMAVLAFGMLVALWSRVGPELRIPVAVYVVAIVGMGVSAITTDALAVIAGAALFMASDTLLASEKFLLPAISPHRQWMRLAVWALYYAAQASITLGFLSR